MRLRSLRACDARRRPLGPTRRGRSALGRTRAALRPQRTGRRASRKKLYTASAGEIVVSLPTRDYELMWDILATAIEHSAAAGTPVDAAIQGIRAPPVAASWPPAPPSTTP